MRDINSILDEIATEAAEQGLMCDIDNRRAVQAAQRGLDYAVAEHVMGWPILVYDQGGHHPHQGDHKWHDDPANYPYFSRPFDGGDLLAWYAPDTDGVEWRPSVDIRAAMEVVQGIAKLQFHVFELRYIAVWMCRFQNVISGASGGYTANHPATSAPYVICRAALNAIGKEHKR